MYPRPVTGGPIRRECTSSCPGRAAVGASSGMVAPAVVNGRSVPPYIISGASVIGARVVASTTWNFWTAPGPLPARS